MKTKLTRSEISLTAMMFGAIDSGSNLDETKNTLGYLLKCHKEIGFIKIDSDKFEPELEQMSDNYVNDILIKTTEYLALKTIDTKSTVTPDDSPNSVENFAAPNHLLQREVPLR